MIWPPVKAWTSVDGIDRNVHFVAINYGGKLEKKWVIMMSVIDSKMVLKVHLSELLDSSQWVPGWEDVNNMSIPKLVDGVTTKTNDLTHPSIDSGLTVPITVGAIRPWFEKS